MVNAILLKLERVTVDFLCYYKNYFHVARGSSYAYNRETIKTI